MESLDQQITLFLNQFYNNELDTFFWYVSLKYTWFVFGALLLIYLFIKKRTKEALLFLLFMGIMVLCTDQLCNLVKHGVARLRPCWDEEISPMVHIVNNDRGGKYGFFSAHSAIFFGLAYMTSQYFQQKYYTISIYAIAILVAYSRIYLGRHYLGDVLVGAIVGTLFAILAWKGYTKLYKKINQQTNK